MTTIAIMETPRFEDRYRYVHRRTDEVLAMTNFTLEHYGDTRLTDHQLELGAFAARVCSYETTPAEPPRRRPAAGAPVLYLVPPVSRAEQD